MRCRDDGRETEAEPLLLRVGRTLRRIIGAPDYDTYLEHCRRAGHPPRLSEREFVDECLASKGKGVRCC